MTGVAGTPSSFSGDVASPTTLYGLEFERVLDVVAARAAGPLGAAVVRARRPAAELTAVRDALAAVGELADLLRAGDGFRAEPIDDLTPVLDVLEKPGAPLTGEHLVVLARGLASIATVAAELARLDEEAPRVAALAVPVPPARLGRAITDALDPEGRVRDGADGTVDRARRRVRETRDRLIALLEATLRTLGSHETPPDAAVTLRGDRYVIPVLRDARRRVAGIVHGESGSGATLFVEPQEAVEPGNELAAAHAAERRAVHAVLRRLTDRARDHTDTIRAGFAMCVAVDDLYARARYAVDADGVVPELATPPAPHRLVGARHPLLLAEGVEAVPFDLTLGPDELGVVISGPNTGGKTVLLKAVGLMHAMAQAGIVPPLGPGSRLPVVRRLIADIGDHQSIEANLSTFSAHLVALRTALTDADHATLVLLDEIGTGTDPVEGAALAGAALETLVERGARTIATTHLSALKDLAAEGPGIVNASLQFDPDTLTPTYRLVQGVPGRSYGLVIAGRLGLPEDVLRRAADRVPEDARSLDAVVADVERRVAALDDRERSLEEREIRVRGEWERVERLREELERLEDTLRRRERSLEREGREQARAFLLQARRRVEDALATARAAVSEATAREARRLVEAGIEDEAAELRRLEERLRTKGWRVKLGEAGGTGRSHAAGPSPGTPARPSAGGGGGVGEAVSAASEIDLRGTRAEAARHELRRAVDAAVVAGLPALRIIHGKGTGALRALVHEELAQDARVAAHRLAPPPEGGTGVTIAELA